MTRAQGGIRTWLAALAVAASTVFVLPTTAHASGAGTLAADINGARASAGLGALSYDGSLAGVAQAWANHMAAADQLAHNPSTPALIRGGWSAWGENVGFTTTGSASTLHQAFMASSEHRANILNRSFTSVGVGWATKNGHTYVAEVFAAYPQASGSTKSGSGSTKSGSKASGSKASGSTSSGSRSGSGASGSTSSEAGGSSSSTGSPARSSAGSAATGPTSTASPTAPPHPDGLVLGDVGPKVRAMQVRLGVHGRAVRADGVFGSVTDHAVRAFQHDAGLTVDGIVGARTSAALAKPAPKRAAATPKAERASAEPTATLAPPRATPEPTTPTAARDHAAARSEDARGALAARLASTPSPSVFASPVAFTQAVGAAVPVTPEGSGPGAAATLGAILVLAAAGGAAAAWAVRRRRA
ncbi:CAP domain-containing protein [Luteimicrobium sp. DT211]|uniref:CAP domain-containing protein n=1 Tax=Luteimicrobium sp. DT211 TaxID=3393412 RepID=UPI003CEB015E